MAKKKATRTQPSCSDCLQRVVDTLQGLRAEHLKKAQSYALEAVVENDAHLTRACLSENGKAEGLDMAITALTLHLQEHATR